MNDPSEQEGDWSQRTYGFFISGLFLDLQELLKPFKQTYDTVTHGATHVICTNTGIIVCFFCFPN